MHASIAYSAACFRARNGESMFHHQWLFAAESCHLHDNGPSVGNKRLCFCAYAPVISLGTHLAGTHFTEHKTHELVNRQNQHSHSAFLQPLQLLFFYFHESVPGFFIPRGRGFSWTSGALSIRHTRAAIFEHFNPLIDDSTCENFIPILSTHTEMNVCSQHTFCPQKAYDRTLLPLWCNL